MAHLFYGSEPPLVVGGCRCLCDQVLEDWFSTLRHVCSLMCIAWSHSRVVDCSLFVSVLDRKIFEGGDLSKLFGKCSLFSHIPHSHTPLTQVWWSSFWKVCELLSNTDLLLWRASSSWKTHLCSSRWEKPRKENKTSDLSLWQTSLFVPCDSTDTCPELAG